MNIRSLGRQESWTHAPETDGVLAACRRLGVGFVVGREFPTGAIRRSEEFVADDDR